MINGFGPTKIADGTVTALRRDLQASASSH